MCENNDKSKDGKPLDAGNAALSTGVGGGLGALIGFLVAGPLGALVVGSIYAVVIGICSLFEHLFD
jgi:hypothetical protein